MENGSSVILSAKGLAVGYRSGKNVVTVLYGLDLTLNRGELVCLLGANGIGKSTLLRTLSGVQNPMAGNVTIAGRCVSLCSPKEMSKLISIVYTDRTLAGALTVNELVALGRQPYTGFFGRLDREDRNVVRYSLEAVGMEHKSNDYVATLSDGERQKVMIARALAQETPVIILDEPTAFLDVASRIDIMQRLQDLAVNHGKAVLLSSHDINCSLSLAHRVWLLRHDRSMIDGVTEDVVLGGEFDAMFPGTRNVIFDPMAGDFRADACYPRSVSLDCDDAVLNHWITNALNRNMISVSCDCGVVIKATSATDISVNGVNAKSIADMITLIDRSLA